MTPEETVVLSALNETVPVAVNDETLTVDPAQMSEKRSLGTSMHACTMVQSPSRSPPHGGTWGQADPLLPAPALLPTPALVPAPLEPEPEDPPEPEPPA